jgi:hypothetical protein
VETEIFLGKIRDAISDAERPLALYPARLLVLIATFPLAGSPEGEDIDAGSLATKSLETELLRRGASVIPSPASLPWDHLAGRVSAENKVALAAAEGRRLEADYVVLGQLSRKADNLLAFTAQLLSVATEKTIVSLTSPVELQTGQAPQDFFLSPSDEIARGFERRLAGRSRSGP